ncbi:MAG: hypothetical protein WC629_00605 [Candidatus Paceibacterota bacterium]|jgi:hypothetical protein
MFIASIIFFTSLFFLVAMIGMRVVVNKLDEEHFIHKKIDPIKRLNLKMHQWVDEIKKFIRFFNKKTFTLLAYFLIEKADFYFHKLIKQIKAKLPHK